MKHIFDVEIAKKYGVHAAVILENIGYWVHRSEANDTNFYDGYYWTYNSKRAIAELFPYLTERQTEFALQKLIDAGLVLTGSYNKSPYDRTLWYTLSNSGKSILQNCGMNPTKLWNESNEIVEPIPNINTNINTNVNANNILCRAEAPTAHPETQESQLNAQADEVIAYLNEKTGKHFRPVESARRILRGRFNDGFTVADCKKVVDNKVAEWLGTEQEQYLRPSTLFQALKFDGYLNQDPAKGKNRIDPSEYETGKDIGW